MTIQWLGIIVVIGTVLLILALVDYVQLRRAWRRKLTARPSGLERVIDRQREEIVALRSERRRTAKVLEGVVATLEESEWRP